MLLKDLRKNLTLNSGITRCCFPAHWFKKNSSLQAVPGFLVKACFKAEKRKSIRLLDLLYEAALLLIATWPPGPWS
jgi:hypothetical protein